MNVVVTGSLGFIGSHLILKLLKQKKFKKIYGIDFENKKNKKLKHHKCRNQATRPATTNTPLRNPVT